MILGGCVLPIYFENVQRFIQDENKCIKSFLTINPTVIA